MDPDALDLATKTLAKALDALMSKGSPIAPLVVISRGGELQVQKVTVGRGEDAAAKAKEIAATQVGASASAFATNGTILYNDIRYDAVIVEAWNFVTNRGARVGLRFELKGMRKKPSFVGSPLHRRRAVWYDPEDGEPVVPTFPEVGAVPMQAQAQAPVSSEVSGLGPPPLPSTLAPSDVAPPPPASLFEAPRLPRALTPDAPSVPDFGPPPTTPAVAFDPPASHIQRVLDFPPPLAPTPIGDVPPAVVVPVVQVPVVPVPAPVPVPVPPAAVQPAAVQPPPRVPTAPTGDAHPVEPPAALPEVVAPTYVPVPIQRNETPLGNRAMFAGVMEMATKGRSFPAFAIVQRGGEWEQVTMTDANLAETAASVRAYARSLTDADFIAFAVDSFVSVDGADVTAVVVEVWEYSTRVSFSVAQRYVPTGDPPSPRLSGRPLMRTQAGWVDVPSSMMLGGQVQFAYSDPGSA